MPSLGVPEIVLIVVVLILLFGAKRLPEIARSLGKAKTELRKGLDEGSKEADAESKSEEKTET